MVFLGKLKTTTLPTIKPQAPFGFYFEDVSAIISDSILSFVLTVWFLLFCNLLY